MKQVVAALGQITTANGYSNTLASVQRENLTVLRTTDLPTVLVKEGECVVDLNRSIAPSIYRRMELFFVILATQDDAPGSLETRSGSEILNSLVADLERCIAEHRTWGGLALQTSPPQYIETEVATARPTLSKGLECEVSYEHLRLDPFRQA